MDVGVLFPTFAALLRQYRLGAGLSQEALAERAGLSLDAVSALERGLRQTPRRETVQLLAQALGLEAAERAALEACVQRRRGAAAPAPSPGSPTAVPLAGRQQELILLEQHLRGAGPPVLLLAGEPGIGKSRLLHEAAGRAPQAGLCTLRGGCHRSGGQEPYAPVLDALAAHVRTLSPAQLRAALQGCGWLVRLLPELATGPIAPLPPWKLAPEHERRLMFEAVARFLSNVAGPEGTLLVLDDLQWAGDDALTLLAVLVRSTTRPPVRVLGAYRDTEIPPGAALSLVLADLAHAEVITHHTLAPLSAQESVQVLDHLLEGEDTAHNLRAQVVRRAEGVPFYLISCARALRGGVLAHGGQNTVPWDMRQGIRQRVAALSATAQEVLGVAAVMGRVVPYGVVGHVSGQPTREVLAAFEAVCRAQLLVEHGPMTYQFTHDVIREVVERELGAARRVLLHRRIAAALERQPGTAPIEALAYHYGRGEVAAKAVLYLEQAGDRAAAQHANAAAEAYYQELVQRLEELGSARDSARAQEKLGAALRTQGRFEMALCVFEQAAETYRLAGDHESLAGATAQIGRVHADRGTPAEGVRRLELLLAILEQSGVSQGLAAVHAVLARLYWGTGHYAKQMTTAAQAASLARTAHDDRVLAMAATWHALALNLVGRVEEAHQVAEEAIEVARMVGDLSSLRVALTTLVGFYEAHGDLVRSGQYIDQALEVAEQEGDPSQIVFMLGNRSAWHFVRGTWDQARRDGEQALALSRQTGPSWACMYPLFNLGRLCQAQGDRDAAMRYVDEGVLLAERSGDLQALRWAHTLLAEDDLAIGRPHAARERLVPLLDRPGLEERDVTEFLPVLARAHLQTGDLGPAGQVAEAALRRARATDQLTLVEALWTWALVALRREQWEEAGQAMEEGLARARRLPYPYAEARFLQAWGEAWGHQGKHDRAREQLQAARAIFQHLGAYHDLERVEQALSTLPPDRTWGDRSVAASSGAAATAVTPLHAGSE